MTLEIKQEEVNILLEALLFASSVNVGADWSEKDINKMVNLSRKLKKQLNGNTKLDKIVFYKEENYEDNWTQGLFKTFEKELTVIPLQQA